MHSYPTRFQARIQKTSMNKEHAMLLEEMRTLQQMLGTFMRLTGTVEKLVAANDAYHYLVTHPHLITEALKLTLRKKIPELRHQINDAIRKNLLRSMVVVDNRTIIAETINICHAAYALESTFQTIEPLYMF
jgi:hypothetical protein